MVLHRPWLEPDQPHQASHLERYALRADSAGGYLAVADQDGHIATVSSSDQAWQFHTHQKAVQTARHITRVMGTPVDVVKLL